MTSPAFSPLMQAGNSLAGPLTGMGLKLCTYLTSMEQLLLQFGCGLFLNS